VRFRMASYKDSQVSYVNARRRVVISNRTSPKENRSVRASSCSPRTCSGDI